MAKPKGPNTKLTCRNEALRILAERHPEEFHGLFQKECDKRGIDYTIPETRDERAARKRQAALAKARRQAAQMLADFPELAPDFAPTGLDEFVKDTTELAGAVQ